MATDRRRSPTGVGAILEDILARIDPEKRIGLWQKWDEVVGEPIASHARPSRIEDGVLIVTVSNHTWAQELQLLEEDLIERLNRAFGEARVRDIYFVIGAEPAAERPSQSLRRRR